MNNSVSAAKFYFRRLDTKRLEYLSEKSLGMRRGLKIFGYRLVPGRDMQPFIQWLQTGQWRWSRVGDGGLIRFTKRQMFELTGIPITVTVAPDGSRCYLDRKKTAFLGAGGFKNISSCLKISENGALERYVAQRFRSNVGFKQNKSAMTLLANKGIRSPFATIDSHTYKTDYPIARRKGFTKAAFTDLAQDIQAKLTWPFKRFSDCELRIELRKLLPVFDEMAHWHCSGLAHRDIKPQNLFKIEGFYRVADVDSVVDSEQSYYFGTESYKLPIMNTMQSYSIATLQYSDAFALGLTLLHLYEGPNPRLLRFNNRFNRNFWQNLVYGGVGKLPDSRQNLNVAQKRAVNRTLRYLYAKEKNAIRQPCSKSLIEPGLRQLIIKLTDPISPISLSQAVTVLKDLCRDSTTEKSCEMVVLC